MKLIHKTTRYYLIYALFIFGLGTFLFYYIIKIILLDGIDEAIHQEKVQLIENLNYENLIEELKPSENIEIKLSKETSIQPDKYSIVKVYDNTQANFVDYRQLNAIYKHNNKFYEIRIRQSMEEAEALLNGILPAEIGLFLLFLIGVLIMNNYVNRSVWEPFYKILDNIKNYDFEKTKVIPFEKTEIKEFKELGMSIEKMTDKIYKDFIRQKEFNENTSHELQTPVAIIRNKLELLIQSKNLREEDMEIIESVFDAVKRLSLLNKGLLLISKIENRQFTEIQKVNIINLIEECIQNYQFQIQEKNIVLDNQFTTDFAIESNPILMEILINNLLSNAIKHNFDKGYIHIKITNGFLVIENSGKKLNVETDTIFERFKKDSDSEQSIGLGLAIVKKICLLLDYKIKYYNKEEVHRMEVKLS